MAMPCGTPDLCGGVAGCNKGNGTIKNCVALNATVTATTFLDVGRVVGWNELGELSNNYARDDMSGSTAQFTDTTSGDKDGKDISSTEYHDATWWTGSANWSNGGWDLTIWEIENGKLPILKGVGGTQNPTIVP
ncbi:MAG: hypothetical protein FWH53_01675 [Leptospirales bacterium]|nr:hypothetical protein [Leptospirales bacterium]